MKTLMTLIALFASLNAFADAADFSQAKSCLDAIHVAEAYEGAQQQMTHAWYDASDFCQAKFAGNAKLEGVFKKLQGECSTVWDGKPGSMYRTLSANCDARGAQYVNNLIDIDQE
jgi:hypothetical protein